MSIRIKNVGSGDLSIAELNIALKQGEETSISRTVAEAMRIPSIRRHVMRGHIKVSASKSESVKKAAPKPKPKSETKPEPKAKPKKTAKVYKKADLENMKMDKLRKIGKPLGAKDTKKSELIAEILKLQKKG